MNAHGEKINSIYSKEMNSIDKVALSKNISFLIEDKGLSLHIVSTKSGVNKSTLHNYINGVLPQGLSALLKLCDYFDVTLEDLVFSKNYQSKKQKSLMSPKVMEEKYEIIIKKVVD